MAQGDMLDTLKISNWHVIINQ